MRLSDVFTASLVVPLVAAHGGVHGAPKLFGMPRNLRARNPWTGHQNVGHPAGPHLNARQEEGRCGTQGGGASCPAGSCCSPEGYCGTTTAHCAAPDCQINFGPGCDANKTPYGASTAQDSRRQLGNIAYGGVGIRECLKPKTIAITYDDGPYIYTEQVMAQFEARNAHATFFVTGNNLGKGSIDENWTGVISKMYANGHQVASHTWSHQNLDQITHDQRVDQMVKNEMAIRNILGKYPTYMRPPYSACITEACMADMATLGYVITSFDLDTDDYNNLTPEKIQNAKNNFKNSLDTAGPNDDRLAIAHDIHELTALNLTGYMLDYVYSKGWTAVTVGECMNDPEANWYRDSTPGVKPSATPSSSAPVPTPTGPTSQDGQCGSATGQSCIGFTGPAGLSECCSPSGWCGNSDAYCGTGCNPLYGKCGPQPSVSSSATVTSAAPLPTVSLVTSTGGDCGFTAGKTCKGFMLEGVKAECCSEYNFCGNSEAYCGTGCNPVYGNCGSSGSSSSSSASASASASLSASVSSTVSASASPSVSLTSSAVASSSASVSSSASQHVTSSSANSASASVSVSASASANDHASSSVHVTQSPSVSASVSASKHDSSSVPESKSSSVSVSVSASATPSASASKHDSASSAYPTIISTADAHSTHTPTPVYSVSVSKDNVYPSGSPSTVYPDQSSTMVYPSTMSTLVRPTSTPCDDDKVSTPTPTPSAPVSKDGKCGKDNGGQTCAGYKDPFGQTIECCCKESGRCSTDPWACGVGCDAKYGKCKTY